MTTFGKTLFAGLVIILGIIGWFIFDHYTQPVPEVAVVRSFEECVAAGYPVMESYPRQCRTKDGRSFTEDIGNSIEKADLIRLITPRPNEIVTSPLIVTGEARGYWFFEASFPVQILDARGNQIAVIPAQAQGEWMTEEFVSFRAELNFATPLDSDTGTLVLEKDNPSGLPENEDELHIPIKFR